MRIYRYEVPVDDHAHRIELQGDPLAVACRSLHIVEFWAETLSGRTPKVRTFRVVGTGHPYGEDYRYWGTAVAPGGLLVWHLLEGL